MQAERPPPISGSMRTILTGLLILAASAADAAVLHVPIKSALVLRPDESYTISIEAAGPTEIGWLTTQKPGCTTSCVQATDLTGGLHDTVATPLGASKKYTPASGRISIEYKNVSRSAVTIDIFRVTRTCEAEACRFLRADQSSRWLVIKVDEFRSISTSRDGSYSVISGVTHTGRAFTVKAIWWTDERPAIGVDCSPSVKRYLESRTPKDQYSPYVISGQVVEGGADFVLKSIDTCAPKAAHFGVPDANVFK